MLTVVRIWILLSTLLVSSAWILSALHELNRVGYAVVFALAAVASVCWQWRTRTRPSTTSAQLWHKFRNRFKRPAPLLFLVLALMSLAGGLLYLSNNGDSNGYRIPRVLHWLAAGRWHWIHTLDPRMNIVGSNFEWLSAPLVLFTGSFRWIFLINIVSYLMLPGLVFSVFARLQVSPRAAWWWMWLLSSGWCFILQAGSDINDSFAAVYALAMVDFALRGHERKCVGDLWLSMLAAALLTGVKQTNIPLALLWLVAAWPGVRLLLARPIATTFITAVGILCSAVPQTVANIKYSGSWQGSLPAYTATVSHWSPMLWKLIGNLFSIPLQNLLPPFFPYAEAWNRAMQHFVQTPLGSHFATFEKFGCLSAGVSEPQAGIGLGICLLMLISFVWVRRLNVAAPSGAKTPTVPNLRWLRLTPWILLLVFMTQICEFEGARLLAAYYPLLFPLLLIGPGNARLVRQPWWQWFALLVMLLAAAMLIVSRNRPLFPARTVEKLGAAPHAKLFSKIGAAYAAPREIIGAETHFRSELPAGEHVVGYATTTGALEPGLWLPFSQRRVERVLPADTSDDLRQRGIHYVLVEDLALDASGITIEDWIKRYNGELVDQFAFQLDRHRAPTHLYLVRLRSSPSRQPSGS